MHNNNKSFNNLRHKNLRHEKIRHKNLVNQRQQTRMRKTTSGKMRKLPKRRLSLMLFQTILNVLQSVEINQRRRTGKCVAWAHGRKPRFPENAKIVRRDIFQKPQSGISLLITKLDIKNSLKSLCNHPDSIFCCDGFQPPVAAKGSPGWFLMSNCENAVRRKARSTRKAKGKNNRIIQKIQFGTKVDGGGSVKGAEFLIPDVFKQRE